VVDSATRRSIRWAQAGLLINAVLVLVKLIAGIVGHANALVADAVESSADIFSSLIVWMGLSIAARPADEDHPYGHGKAEPLAAAVVSLMLLGAAVGISILAIREIRAPHHLPSPFTLFVAAGVIIVKEILYRRVSRVGKDVGSTAVTADAWHHRILVWNEVPTASATALAPRTSITGPPVSRTSASSFAKYAAGARPRTAAALEQPRRRE